ncbi:MAG: hypothetical protein JWN91_2021 [Nocardioides sp.]|jgi:hypothetical protein|nr:hypothetical protein [Nocardioides sp.]
MYDSTNQRDYRKAEVEYRIGRIQSDIAGRRRRRTMTLARRWGVDESTVTGR